MNKRLLLLIIPLISLFSACTTINQTGNTASSVIKSPNDRRTYDYFVLPNSMKVLLVSDPDADKAAAALSVGIGSASDPLERQGLAHFLEHMLFLGTEKYPGLDDYSSFISNNGGSHNAFTAPNITTYFFDVKQDALEPSLDRFAQFFIAPLFTEEYVGREKNAVNSEYMLKIKDKYRRSMAAQRQVYSPDSPYSKFSVGNLNTLSDTENTTIRDDLLAFYRSHYSANIMTLAVSGKESIAELKQWVIDKFSAVKNRHLSRLHADVKLLQGRQLPIRVNIKSLQDIHELSLEFPMDTAVAHYKTQPLRYLAHFIGHEGEGSFLSFLKTKGWATGLSAGSESLDSSESIMVVVVNLTPEGYQHIDTITDDFFDYIELLKTQGVEQWRYDEIQKIAELDFRYREKTSPSSMVTSAAGKMHEHPAEDLLRTEVSQLYNAAMIQRFANQIRPDNMMLTVISNHIETDQTEEKYQVDYSISQINNALLTQWQQTEVTQGLSLPAVNPYIPDTPAVKNVAATKTTPSKLEEQQGYAVWHLQENAFGVPRAEFLIGISSEYASRSVKNTVMNALVVDLLNEQLKTVTYPASLAGLHANLDDADDGLVITISGYDQKQPLILNKVIKVLKQPELSQDRFDTYVTKMRQGLENAKFDKPFRQVINARKRYLVQPSWDADERLKALDTITLSDLQKFLPELLRKIEVKALAYGNVTPKEAQILSDLVKKDLLHDSHMVETADPMLTLLPRNKTTRQSYRVDHPDSVIIMSYQGVDRTVREQAQWKLLGQIAGTPFFSELRTKQQLGYVVFAGYTEREEMPEYFMLVQSSVVDSTELEKRVDTFTNTFIDILKQMPAEEFTTHKNGVITNLLKKDQKMHDRVSRFINNIARDNFSFDLNKKMADEISKLDQQTIISFYQDRVLDHPARLIFSNPGTRN